MCVPRYYPLFPRAFTITKRLTAEQCPLTDDLRESVLAAHDLAELYDIMGRDYWWVFGWLAVVCAAEALTVCVVQGGVSVPFCCEAGASDGRHTVDHPGEHLFFTPLLAAHPPRIDADSLVWNSIPAQTATSLRFARPAPQLEQRRSAILSHSPAKDAPPILKPKYRSSVSSPNRNPQCLTFASSLVLL